MTIDTNKFSDWSWRRYTKAYPWLLASLRTRLQRISLQLRHVFICEWLPFDLLLLTSLMVFYVVSISG